MGLLRQWWVVMVLVLLKMHFYSSKAQHLTCHPRDQEALRDIIPEFVPYLARVWAFNSSTNCCELVGVTCKSSSSLGLNDTNNTARVTKLELVYLGLYGGRLSESLGRLDQIRALNLSHNSFSGSIPSSIFNLVNLETLDLSYNMLSGGIPKSLANSHNLILLNLGRNSLSGPLHLNCDVMTSLTSLDLRYNYFNGSLPESLPSCKNLRNINLAGNFFNISSTLDILQQCKNLTTLDLSYNFRGEMLPDHPSLHFENLKVFIVAGDWISGYGLSGPIPSWLRKSANLQMLDLSENRLSGTIPNWTAGFTNLQVLDLSENRLTGPIPNWIGGFTNLFYLGLSGNLFTGEIPKSLTRLQSLSSSGNLSDIRNELQIQQISEFLPTIQLSYNNLSRPIWEEFGNLKNLHVFDLSDNILSGSIPESLNNLELLSQFSVANNNLSGRIPSRLSETFSCLSFKGNHFSGDDSPQCQVDTPRSKSSEEDYVLDFSYGVALGYGLALVIVSLITCSAFEIHSR